LSKRKSRGLGRGLGALIPTDTETSAPSAPDSGNGLRTVKVADIIPNPHQPRTEFDEVKLEELAASIKEHGLIQPLIVTEQADGQFALIAGERRWRAAQIANLVEVPVVVKETTPQEMLELAIIENVQRADLNPLEEALAYRQLMDEFGLTQSEVAKRMGKGRSTVANLVRLLELPTQIQKAVNDGLISGRHAREMLRLGSVDEQTAVLQRVLNEGLNVKQLTRIIDITLSDYLPEIKQALLANEITDEHAAEIGRLPNTDDRLVALSSAIKYHYTVEEIQKWVDNKLADRVSAPTQRRTLSPELAALEDRFKDRLNAKVDIQKGARGGKVVIYYADDEDLNNIYDTIIGDWEE